ncbi:MAG: HNH endonuclease family protein, partial [Defluviitaleaceae bacterium]|nr:HNH endonuclease family protein [Defluviitaleaceae bacterium]
RTLQFTDDDFSSVLYFKYGGQNTLPVLSILCPWADLRNKFHVDHIFPRSKFTKPYLRKMGVPESSIERFIKNRDFIGNLQLLEGVQNQEKSDMDFEDWMSNLPAEQVDNFKEKHFIPTINLTFGDFETFLAEREQMLIDRLRKELQK